MPDDSAYPASHGAVGVQMAVNLETNFPISFNQQLKINLSNNWKFVVDIIHNKLSILFQILIFYITFIKNGGMFCEKSGRYLY
jgi:hypothetical protein